MKRRTLLAASAAVPFAAVDSARAQSGKVQVVWWHAMTGVNADEINRLARAFSESQAEAEVLPVYKGGYADALTAAIAAWRADQAPHLVQIFEVGTGSMLASVPRQSRSGNWRRKPAWTLIPPPIFPVCAATTVCRMAGWRRCRSIRRPL